MSQVCVFGEVLFDHFPDGSRVLGGAPFNVAWHLQAFGQSPAFISRIGNDPEGDTIRRAMQAWGMRTDSLQIDTKHPTGRVMVELVDGEPAYDIVRPSAWDAIEAQDRRPVEGTGKKRRCRVRLVVRREQQRRQLQVVAGTFNRQCRQLVPQRRLEKQFVFEPDRHGGKKRPEPGGHERKIGFQESLELDERLLVKADVIQIRGLNLGLLKTVLDSPPGKTVVVLLAAEAFFFRCGDEHAVVQEGGREGPCRAQRVSTAFLFPKPSSVVVTASGSVTQRPSMPTWFGTMSLASRMPRARARLFRFS